jgi:hypothetical protein
LPPELPLQTAPADIKRIYQIFSIRQVNLAGGIVQNPTPVENG